MRTGAETTIGSGPRATGAIWSLGKTVMGRTEGAGMMIDKGSIVKAAWRKGVPMRVEIVEAENRECSRGIFKLITALCAWTDVNGARCSAWFPVAQLVRV